MKNWVAEGIASDVNDFTYHVSSDSKVCNKTRLVFTDALISIPLCT